MPSTSRSKAKGKRFFLKVWHSFLLIMSILILAALAVAAIHLGTCGIEAELRARQSVP